MLIHYTWDSRAHLNGPAVIGVAVRDPHGNTTTLTQAVVVDNPVPIIPDIDIVTVTGTDPVKLNYRTGNSGKNVVVALDAKHRGRVRVNGVMREEN